MTERKPAIWTNQWVRELPWRTLQKWRRQHKRDFPSLSITQQRRFVMLEREWIRRKREGGGGWAAKDNLYD